MRRRDEQGATVVEYGMIVAAMLLLSIVAIMGLQTAAGAVFSSQCDQITQGDMVETADRHCTRT